MNELWKHRIHVHEKVNSKTTTYLKISTYEISIIDKSIEIENKLVIARAGGGESRRNWELLLNGYGFPLGV